MELQEFIRQTLDEIVKGVQEAQKLTEKTGAIINPSELAVGSQGDKYLMKGGWRYTTNVEINVALSIQEREGNKTGIGVFTGFISGATGLTTDSENKYVSSVKFTVPIALPTKPIPPETKGRPGMKRVN